jgi:hypothetical protein
MGFPETCQEKTSCGGGRSKNNPAQRSGVINSNRLPQQSKALVGRSGPYSSFSFSCKFSLSSSPKVVVGDWPMLLT